MNRVKTSHLSVIAQTHPGMAGKNNEDNFAVSAYLISPINPTPSVFAIVSDGIGGHKAGEVASELAVNLISEAVEKREGGHPLAVFENSFYKASEAIYSAAEQDTRYKGMGATVACAWVIGQQLYIAYAGDSRIYLIRNGQIKQLSHDHTWVQEAQGPARLYDVEGGQVVGTPEGHARLGESKIRPRHAYDFTLLILRTIVFFNPLKVFIPLAFFLTLGGLAKFAYDVTLDNLSESAVLLFLGALIVFAVGLLADQNARMAIKR